MRGEEVSQEGMLIGMSKGEHMAMGQNPVPPVNIPFPTKIGSKMGGAAPKWDTIDFDPQPYWPKTSPDAGNASTALTGVAGCPLRMPVAGGFH